MVMENTINSENLTKFSHNEKNLIIWKKKMNLKMKKIKNLTLFLVFGIIFIYLVSTFILKPNRNQNLKNYISIDVYYETRCSDSAIFLSKVGDLKPKLLKNVFINLVPFGKASVRPAQIIFCLKNFLF